MYKRFYALATLLLVIGLTSIIAINIKFTQDSNEQGLTEVAHIRQDIVAIVKSTLSEELTDANQNLKLSNLNKTTLNEDENRIEELLTFSEDFFDMLLVDEQLALSMLANMLNEDELLIMETILSEAFGNESTTTGNTIPLSSEYKSSSMGNAIPLAGGYAKLRLYVHASYGWFWGRLSTTLLTIAITPVVVQFVGLGAAAGGPVGVIVGALIGATLGVAIERYINHLVYRNGVAGFTYDLINTTLVEGWLVPFKITIQYNLLNALFSIINFAGGNWSAGAAGAPRPSTLPSFGYAK